MHVSDLGWDSRLASGEFGAFLAGTPSGAEERRERGTAGENTEKSRGLSAKSVTQWNSAQWTAGCFRDLSGAFLQKDHRARGRRPTGPFSALLGRRGPISFFLFLEDFNRVFFFLKLQ